MSTSINKAKTKAHAHAVTTKKSKSVPARKPQNGKSAVAVDKRQRQGAETTNGKLHNAGSIKFRFKLIKKGLDQGVYLVLADKSQRKISPPMIPLGLIADADGGNPAVRIKMRTRFEKIRAVEVAKNDFKTPQRLLSKLIEKGLDVDHELSEDRAKLIHVYLRDHVPNKTWLRVKRDGWLRLPNGAHGYVLGEELYCAKDSYLIARDLSTVSEQHIAGDLEAWLRITSRIGDDPVAVLMLSAGLASVLLHPLGRDATFVIIVADSGKGKTTILKLANAQFRSPMTMATWEATANGLEAAAKKFQHKPFVVDEVGQGEARQFGNAAYRLTNLGGKLRADVSSNMVENARAVSVILSAGEQSPIAMMMAARMDVKAGQRARLICIPVSEKHGVWTTIKGFGSGAEKSKQLAAMVQDCHGVAGAAYCKHIAGKVDLLAVEYAEWASKLRKKIANGIKLNPDDGVVDRVLENFVLFAYAGMQAIEAGIVEWTQNQIVHATQRGFSNWLAEHQASLPVTDDEIMQRLRLFFQSKRGAKFKPYNSISDGHAGDVAGFEHTMKNGESLFLVYPAYFEQEICKGLDKKRVIKLLIERGLLVTSPRKTPTKQFKVPDEGNKNVSFYAIRQSILTD